MADIPFDALQSGGGDGVILNGTQAFTFNVGALGGIGYQVVAGINASSGLTTLLSLTGKYTVPYLTIQSISTTSGTLQVQLIVDGVTVMNATESSSTLATLNVINAPYSNIKCNSSFEVKVTKPTATAVAATYVALAVL